MTSSPAYRERDVAVIGMAGRFPGAHDLDAFWANLRNGIESISFFTEEEVVAAGVDPELAGHPDYVRAGGALEGANEFDPGFFGIQPRDAELMDPQHRVLLECAWNALEQAGYVPRVNAGAVGVYVGSSLSAYLLRILSRPDLVQRHGSSRLVMLNDRDFLATRLSYNLDLRGPSLVVQTACSTSLVAICQASEAVINGVCDMALAGGVSILVPQQCGHLYTEGGIDSPDGHCRPFDAKAQGTVAGSGAGMVLLKPLVRAIEDGDHVHAVIRGTAVNNDGSRKVGYSAPSVGGQAAVIAEALGMAEIDPSEVSYIEAHGTATPIGDPIEIAALRKVFGPGPEKRCGIGSVKSNIGHLDAAAGVAGFIKTVLALDRRILPPSLHFERPNPKLELDRTPFYVLSEAREWRADTGPRRAGVSSFGVGGTNAHVVLEEAPKPERAPSARPAHLLLLSARSESALGRMRHHLADSLETRPTLELADVAHTLQAGRARFPQRWASVCRDRTDAAERLRSADLGKGAAGRLAAGATPSVCFMFPGQGSQSLDMARELYETEPVYREELDRCAELLAPHVDFEPGAVLSSGGDSAELDRTRVLQPALFAVEYSLSKLWMSWGVEPDAMIGHSVGEFVAAALAGVFSLEDALRLVAVRGRLMEEQPPGAMLAVPRAEAEIAPLLGKDLWLAAVNGPRSCAISGTEESIARLEKELEAAGEAGRRLRTSRAFHSGLLDAVVPEFASAVSKTDRHEPRIPFISNVTGTWITDRQAADPGYWSAHLRDPVRFSSGIEALRRKDGFLFLEVGPGRTLTSLVAQMWGPGRPTVWSSLPHRKDDRITDLECMLRTLGQLWVAGVEPDWARFRADEPRRRVPLPTYPFERKQYWVGAAPRRDAAIGRTRSGGPAPGVTPATASTAEAVARPPTEPQRPAAAGAMTAGAAAHGAAGGVLERLRGICADLLGKDPRDLDADLSFIELGADSLVLVQASRVIEEEFGVATGLRVLMETADTLQALSRYVADRSQTLASSDRHTTPGGAGGSHPAAAAGPGAGASAGPDAGVDTAAADGPAAPGPDAAAAERFGPYRYRPPALGSWTAEQAAFLEAFVRRWNARTSESKRLTDEYRSVLADPRASAEFRIDLKELIYPIYAARSRGSRFWDLDGNEYLDFVMGFGVHLFGHAPDFVLDAVRAQLGRSAQIGPPLALAGEVAGLVSEMTGLERVAFSNTGSEAVMGALRLARAATGRTKVALFAGAYHGNFDGVLVRPNARAAHGLGRPAFTGVTPGSVEDVLVLPFGDPDALATIEAHGPELAAVLVEPIHGPAVQDADFLHELRRLTRASDTALVFDEVVTGFRLGPRGGQGWFDVDADIATYGKLVGGGLPIGIIAGSARFMDRIDGGAWRYGDGSYPAVARTFLAGTFTKNPLSVAAAHAVLTRLKQAGPGLQRDLNDRTDGLVRRLREAAEEAGAPIRFVHAGSMFMIEQLRSAGRAADLLFYALLEKGIYIRETRFCFLSTAHSDGDVDALVDGFRQTLAEFGSAGLFDAPGRGRPAAYESRTGSASSSDIGDPTGAEPLAGEPSASAASNAVTVPLTPIQRWYFAHESLVSDHFNLAALLEVVEPLDVRLLQRAVDRLVERHGALRLRFERRGREWVQRMLAVDAGVRVQRRDLSLLADSEIAPALEAELAKVQASLDIRRGPLMRVVYFDPGPGRSHRLFLVVHHLAVDALSLQLLLGDLGRAYERLEGGGRDGAVRNVPGLRAWAEGLVEFAASEELARELEFWESQTRGDDVRFPRDRDGENTLATERNLTVTLDAEDTTRLVHRAPQAYGTRVDELVLSAVVEVLSAWQGSGKLVVDLEAHGREHVVPGVDVMGTVGWFTAIHPVAFDLDGLVEREARVRSVSERVRAVPRGGLGYGVLRYMHPDPAVRNRLAERHAAEASFAYLGRLGTAAGGRWRPAPESPGPGHSGSGSRPYLLDVTGAVVDGRLRLTWGYGGDVHEDRTVRKLAEQCLDALRALVGRELETAGTVEAADG